MKLFKLKNIFRNSFEFSHGKKKYAFVSLFMMKLIKFYQNWLSPILPVSCRFYPSCSSYALTSFKNLGFWKATFRSIWRILKCNPFHPGGFDPVSGESLSKNKDCKVLSLKN